MKRFYKLISVLLLSGLFFGFTIGNSDLNLGVLSIGNSSISTPGGGLDLSKYYLYLNIPSVKDQVSKQDMTSDFDAGRVDGEGGTYDENIPVIYDSWLFHYPTYENLAVYSEDTSNWTGSGPWTQSVNLTSTGTYTISTNLNGATLTVTAGTATIDAGASATFGSPDQFVVTGTGTVTLSTDTANPKTQLTKSTYALPYVKTEAATVTVTNNAGSADEGNFFPIGDGSTVGDNLLDAFDGERGTELSTDGDFETNLDNWQINGSPSTFELSTEQAHSGSRSLKIVSTGNPDGGQGEALNKPISVELGARYEETVWIYISVLTSGKVLLDSRDNDASANQWLDVFSQSTTTTNQWVKLTRIGNAVTTNLLPRFRFDGVGTVYIDDYSVKKISDATAELELEWMPMYSAGDIGADVNILDIDGTGNFLIHDDVNNLLEVTDGTNTATVACSPVAGTAYKINIPWGDNSGQKMQIFLDDVGGSAVTNAGTFGPGNYLKFAYESEYFKTRNLIIYKEPQSWGLVTTMIDNFVDRTGYAFIDRTGYNFKDR